MKTPIFLTGSAATNVSNSADRFLPFAGSGPAVTTLGTLVAGTIGNASQSPIAGVVSALRVRFSTPLTQGSYSVTLMKGTTQANMVATGLTATISATGIDAFDLVTTVAVAAGEYLAWKVSPSGTPTAQTQSIQVACLFEATTAGRSALYSFIASGQSAGAVAPGAGAPSNLAEAVGTTVMPIAGQITKIYVSLITQGGAPGSGNGRTITLRKGTAPGALADTALTVTFGATDTEKMLDLSGSPIAVAAGDLLSIAQAITGTPVASSVKIAVEFIPATSGQSVRVGVVSSLPMTAARYLVASGLTGTAEANEANVGQIVPVALTVKSLRADTTTAPGTGKSRVATLRKNGADTGLAVSLVDTAASGLVTSDVAFVGGDVIDVAHVPTNTPATSAWTSVATVMTVAAGGSVVNFAPGNRGGETFEGIRNTPKIVVAGTYSGTPTNVQVALYDAPSGGNLVAGWVAAAVQANGVYSHGFTGMAGPGPFYHRVRDNGGTATASTADLYVGAIVHMWGQSQCAKLFSDDVSGLVPLDGMKVRVMTPSSITDVSTASVAITKLDSTTVGLAGRTGSGVVALANQWHRDTGGTIPLMIVMGAYPGTGINLWLTDAKGPSGTDATGMWGTSPSTGLTWFMAAAARYQATAVHFMQGTTDVNKAADVDGGGKGYATAMDELKAKFESLYGGLAVAPLFPVVPHQRSDDGNNTWRMREIQRVKAQSGGTWRLAAWLLDWQMIVNGDPHQAFGATGNIRGGTRLGRGLARLLADATLDIGGPQIVSAVRATSGAYVDVTFDRDIKTPAGSTSGLPGWWISADGSAWSALANVTGAITGARSLRLTPNSGTIAVGSRVDHLRGVPFASDTTGNDYVGVEADMEANYLSKVITDTTAFDGGRGMPASPVMGNGYAIAEASSPAYVTIALGATVTLTKAQLATLRVKDNGTRAAGVGVEPVSLRWERKSGDMTGKPFDGINVPVTIA